MKMPGWAVDRRSVVYRWLGAIIEHIQDRRALAGLRSSYRHS